MTMVEAAPGGRGSGIAPTRAGGGVTGRGEALPRLLLVTKTTPCM
ncbi:MAG: hypothetical protein Q7R39_13860 [Dehalococcoidia bacterium]|nr:hypothetical protein [Dehalococcoidia bacterium]